MAVVHHVRERQPWRHRRQHVRGEIFSRREPEGCESRTDGERIFCSFVAAFTAAGAAPLLRIIPNLSAILSEHILIERTGVILAVKITSSSSNG